MSQAPTKLILRIDAPTKSDRESLAKLLASELRADGKLIQSSSYLKLPPEQPALAVEGQEFEWIEMLLEYGPTVLIGLSSAISHIVKAWRKRQAPKQDDDHHAPMLWDVTVTGTIENLNVTCNFSDEASVRKAIKDVRWEE